MSIDAKSEIEFKSPNLGSSEAEIDYRMITLAIASGVSLPEFILSMYASNNNLASIEKAVVTVAKSIEEKQALLEEEFCRIYSRVIKHAVSRGRLPRDASDKCSFAFPSFNIRDIEAEARVWSLVKQTGTMSDSTFNSKFGLDYEKEVELKGRESSEN